MPETRSVGPNPPPGRDQTSSGLGVDEKGNPVVDPTANVLALVESAIKRLDDLRAANMLRQDDLREAAARHSQEMAALRAEYQQELRLAETERINAIRAVDVQAVQQASTVQETRATALAAQVAASAEAMRSQVAAAATAAATSLAAALEPVQKDIADLRRAQYEAQGQKAQVVESHASSSSLWVAIGGVIAIILGALAIYGFNRDTTPSTPTTPAVVCLDANDKVVPCP